MASVTLYMRLNIMLLYIQYIYSAWHPLTTYCTSSTETAGACPMVAICMVCLSGSQDDVIKWKHFPRYWPFVRGIHRSPVDSPHKSQSRGALIFSLICVWTNGWANTRGAGDLIRDRAHYDVTVMWWHHGHELIIYHTCTCINASLP